MKEIIIEEVKKVEGVADVTSLIIQEKIGSLITAPIRLVKGIGTAARGIGKVAKSTAGAVKKIGSDIKSLGKTKAPKGPKTPKIKKVKGAGGPDYDEMRDRIEDAKEQQADILNRVKASRSLTARIKSMLKAKPEVKQAFISGEAGEIVQTFFDKLPPEIQEEITPDQVMQIMDNIIGDEEPETESGLLQEVKVEDVMKRLDGKKFRKAAAQSLRDDQRQPELIDKIVNNIKERIPGVIPNDIEERYKGQFLNWYLTLYAKALKNHFKPGRGPKLRIMSRGIPLTRRAAEKFFQLKAQGLDRFLEKSNLQDIEDPRELERMIRDAWPKYEEYVEKKTEEDRKNLNTDEFKIFENDQWEVFIPYTRAAAIVLGRGTKWCTAAPGLNYYCDYHSDNDPLIIFISKSDPTDKYQFHYGSRQFMNPKDKPIDKYAEEEGENERLRWYFADENALFNELNDMVINDLPVSGYPKEQSKWQKKERSSQDFYSDRDPYRINEDELNENKNSNRGNIMKEDMKQIILEELQAVLEEAGCAGGAHGRDTAIMPMGGPLAPAIAPLPPLGGGCGSNPVPPPPGNPMGSEYDDTYMLVKSLEILSNQARTLLEAVDAGLTLPSWAEAKIYCAMDDIKSVHATLDRGGVPSGPQPPIIQLAEGNDLADMLNMTGVDDGPTLSTDRVSTGVHINKKLLNNAIGDMLMKLPLRAVEPPHFQKLKSKIRKVIMKHLGELGGKREEPTIERSYSGGKMEPIVARKRDTDDDLSKAKKELQKVNQELKDKPGSKRLKKKKAELEAKCGHLGKK